MTNAPRLITTDVPLTELTGDQLRARVARAKLYLVRMTPVDGAAVPPQLARDHLAYLYRLETAGLLYGYGPVAPEPGRPGYDLAIIAAGSRQGAERIAANAPLQRAGMFTSSVQEHTMNEGVACYVARAMSRRAEALGDSFDQSAAGVDLPHEALAARAVGAQLHLIHLEPTDKPRPAEDAQTGYDHFIWLRSNEMEAKLMSCGPVEPPQPLAPGIWGGGLGVVAASRDEAERIAAAEPSGRAGYRTLSVRSWVLDYGLAAPIAKALETLHRLPR